MNLRYQHFSASFEKKKEKNNFLFTYRTTEEPDSGTLEKVDKVYVSYLLSCFFYLDELCVEALCRMEQANCSFQVFDKHPGIYLFLVHPNEMVSMSDRR